MVEEKSKNVFSVLILIAVILVGILSFGYGVSNSNKINNIETRVSQIASPSYPSSEDIANSVASKINLPTEVSNNEVNNVITEPVTNVESENSKVSEIYDKLFEEDLKEEVAKSIALEEVVESKSFKKLVRNVLNEVEDDEYVNIEEYSDISVIYSVKVEDASVSDDEATVKIEFKVKYINDGDEELPGKAKLYLTLSVSDLDSDEDYEDAEVVEYDESDFEVVKIYEE